MEAQRPRIMIISVCVREEQRHRCARAEGLVAYLLGNESKDGLFAAEGAARLSELCADVGARNHQKGVVDQDGADGCGTAGMRNRAEDPLYQGVKPKH